VGRAFARFWVREGATIDESGTGIVGRRLGRAVARHGDDARHAEVLRLIGDLVAAGSPRVSASDPPRLGHREDWPAGVRATATANTTRPSVTRS
jgi:hypothetical protein